MDANNTRLRVIYLCLVAVACVAAWEMAPLLRKSPAVAHGPHAPAGSVLVNVNMVGFDPAVIDAKAGQRMKLAFFRPNAANCAREVVFPSLGIRKDLPPGETTVVDITPRQTGPLAFQCGMNMLKGQLIVR